MFLPRTVKRKIISSIAALSLVLTPFSSAFAATSFTDISNSYAKSAIEELASKGILNGQGEGKFNPTANISRQDFAVVLARALNLDTSAPPQQPTFSDVPRNSYAYASIEALFKAKLITGIENKKFGMGQALTREQMAVLFVRALGVNPSGSASQLTFSDKNLISDWAKDAVGYAVSKGFIQGIGDNRFDPRSIADRQQIAVVTVELLKSSESQPGNNGTPSQSLSIQPGGSVTTPAGKPIQFSVANAKGPITWSVDKNGVIDSKGLFEGKTAGTAVVTAVVDGVTLTQSVTVTGVDVTSLTLNQTSMNLYVGGASAQLTASVSPDNATDKTIAWSSSNPSVASVNQSGLVTPGSAGSATIVAKTSNPAVSASTQVTVMPMISVPAPSGGTVTPPASPVLTSIQTPTPVTGIANGTSKTAVALGLPSTVTVVTSAGNQSAAVTWDVANSSYDVSDTQSQTFSVNGTVTLPGGVTNPNNVPLTTQISVSVNAQPVTVTGIAPSNGPTAGGTIATITGTGFIGATGVTVGGNAATGFTVNNATQITATIPAGTAGTADVVVQSPNGNVTLTGGFTYIAGPAITNVLPSSGPVAGGTSVTITGTGFTGATGVTVGGTAATAFTVVSDTQITATTPAGTAGARDVVVQSPNGDVTSTGGFTYLAAPTITSVSPTSGPVAGGTSVTITGTGFTGATGVTVGGTAATAFTVVSDTQITATTPAGTAGAKDVVVQSPNGDVTSTGGFTYLAAPTITSVSPTSGPLAGGTTVTITGTGFTGATGVTVGGTAATAFTVVSDTQITATTPAGTAGAKDVVVQSPNGDVTSTGGFTYMAAPTITSVSPTSGPLAGGTSVTITGTGFTGVTAVTFGGTAATSFTVDSATQITATTPAGTAGAVDVVVQSANGSATSAGGFTYMAAPTITSVSPTSGPVAGGTSVTITGTGFTGATGVTVGGTAATAFTVVSDTQITATTPAGTAGAKDVVVQSPNGDVTSTGGFTYMAAPTITSVSPNTGSTAGGTTVTITGTGFTGATGVTVGGVAATGFTVNSATQITATTPAGTAGARDVVVQSPNGNVTSTGGFTYVASLVYGGVYQLATIADATVVGGADIPFSNNGPLDSASHTPGTTTLTVGSSGTYKFDYHVSTTAGNGAQVAIAVNGTVDSSTPITITNDTFMLSGSTVLTLAAGDVVTLRNNSATPLTMTLAPGIGAQLTVNKLSADLAGVYQLATIANATVVGGADIPLSNNGPLSNATHTPGTTTVTVNTTGIYKVDYNASITSGVGSQVAVAVNGTVDSSTAIPFLNATDQVSGSALMNLVAGDVLTLRNNSATTLTTILAPAAGAQLALHKVDTDQLSAYQLATIADATIVGGADIPFSNNGPFSGVTHTPGSTTFMVGASGTYKIDYNVSTTAGVGAQVGIAINGTVNASTTVSVNKATGQVSGSAVLTLAAGDVLTVRNNSAVALTMSLAPSVGAQFSIVRMDQ